MAGREDNRRGKRNEEQENEFIDRLVHINRVAKTVKGGRNMSFAALVIVGDEKGRVGFGKGKGARSARSYQKGNGRSKKDYDTQFHYAKAGHLHHDVRGRHGAGKIVMRAAPPGTGVIAGGPMRAVLECLGVQDVVGKSLGTSNPYNMVRATFEGLKNMESPRTIANKRGKKVGDIVGRRNDGASAPEAVVQA